MADSKVVMAKGGTDADDAKDKDKATEHLNNVSEGSGPYKLVSFTKNVEAVLERNASYWGKKPHFAKVIFKHVPSGTTQREMVERGDADIAHDFDVDIVAKITQGPKIKVLEGLSMNQVYMGVTNSAEQSKEPVTSAYGRPSPTRSTTTGSSRASCGAPVNNRRP